MHKWGSHSNIGFGNAIDSNMELIPGMQLPIATTWPFLKLEQWKGGKFPFSEFPEYNQIPAAGVRNGWGHPLMDVTKVMEAKIQRWEA